MHRRPQIGDDEKYVPPRAMLLVLGAWTVGIAFVALVIVPALFAPCTAQIPPP